MKIAIDYEMVVWFIKKLSELGLTKVNFSISTEKKSPCGIIFNLKINCLFKGQNKQFENQVSIQPHLFDSIENDIIVKIAMDKTLFELSNILKQL